MIFRPPEPLSRRAEKLLAEERNFESESPELRQRVLARARVALRDRELAVGRRLWGGPRIAAVTVAVLTFGAVAVAMWVELKSDADSGSRVVIADGGLARGFPSWEVPPLLSQEPAPDPETTMGRLPFPAPRPSTAEADELALLRQARSALTRGNHASALQAITEHQKRFPSTPLREEREALRIRALDGLGKSDEARRAADRFHERYPRSVLAPRDGTGGGSSP